ncbi:MAG: hypothetical protein Q7J07_09435 [Pelolinea sp.]|nr:hypothetical protein [Pelolinea sp.]
MFLNNLLIFSALGAIVWMFVSSDWRMRLAGLASLYLVELIVILQIWPIALASVKLISGWMGIALLGTVKLNADDLPAAERIPSETIFKLLMAFLVWMVIATVAPSINEWIPISYTNLYIGLAIMGGGILFIGLSNDPFEIVLGLLMFLVGFDVIYSSLEGSALVTGIFALIIILICLISVYFLPSNSLGEVE